MALAEYDHFKADGFFVHYDPDERAIATECFELEGVSFAPDTSLNLPYGELISLALGMAGRPSPGDDEAEGDVVRVESLLFYRPNYWEDSARWRRERAASK